MSQSTLGAPSQSTPFAFSLASAPESKPVFGGKMRNGLGCCSECWPRPPSERYGVAVTDIRYRVRELCVLGEDGLVVEEVGLSEAV